MVFKVNSTVSKPEATIRN